MKKGIGKPGEMTLRTMCTLQDCTLVIDSFSQGLIANVNTETHKQTISADTD